MKLFAPPLIIRVLRQACYGNLFQCPIAIVESLPFPFSIDHRVSKRSTMRRTYAPAVVGIFIGVVVAIGARPEGCRRRFEIRPAVFGMTGDATYARGNM